MTTNIMKRSNGHSPLPAKTVSSWVDQMLQNSLNRFFNDGFWNPGDAAQSGQVPVNLRETDKSYEMELIAPGLQKEDFRLNVSNDILTVSFEKKEENEENAINEGWLRKEYRMSAFTRSFNLDDTIEADKISATYNNGILYISLPKKEKAQRMSRSIEIR